MFSDAEFWKLMDDIAKNDPPACGGCTACCRGNQTVVVSEIMGDNISKYPQEGLAQEHYAGETRLALRRHPNGDCWFLKDGKCSIYEDRPKVCRHFDCRRIAIALSSRQKRLAIKRKVFSAEIINAGVSRQHTAHLLDVEKEIYQPSKIGAVLVNK